MFKCYFIRHGDKEPGAARNPLLRLPDPPLSDRGHEQARKLCSFFSGVEIAGIYVSAYQRTRQTAAPLAESRQLSPVVDSRLDEIDGGRIAGMSDGQIQEAFPDVWQACSARTADFRFPEGETGLEAQERVVGLLEEKRAQHGTGNLILVSHDGLIRLLMCHLVGLPVYQRWNFQVDTCGILEIVYQPQWAAWKVIRFNQVVL